MKHVIYGVLSIVLIVLVVVSLVTVAGRHTREAEMQQALRQAVEESADQVLMQGKYTMDSKEELVADFTSLLVERLRTKDANRKLKVDIAGVDEKKGLLSVHVEESYTHPNGRKGTLETEATMVLEQEEKKPMYQVDYRIPAELLELAKDAGTSLPGEYKTYLLEEGELFKTPSNPPDFGGKRFVAWSDEDGAIYTTAELVTMKVEKSLTLSAVYN